MSELVIRPITKGDIAPCLDIYNYEVVNGVARLILNLARCQSGRSGMSLIAMSTILLW